MQRYCLSITWSDYIFFYNNPNFLSLPIKIQLASYFEVFFFTVCIHFKNGNSKIEKRNVSKRCQEEDN